MGVHEGEAVSAGDLATPLLEACIAAAEARRRLALGDTVDLGRLQTRLSDIRGSVAGKTADGRHAGLLALLDELGGLVGQLEVELEAARARLVAADRHRRAEITYGAARYPT